MLDGMDVMTSCQFNSKHDRSDCGLRRVRPLSCRIISTGKVIPNAELGHTEAGHREAIESRSSDEGFRMLSPQLANPQ
jgi:hypothetical protein